MRPLTGSDILSLKYLFSLCQSREKWRASMSHAEAELRKDATSGV
jgi:hypothetical protein